MKKENFYRFCETYGRFSLVVLFVLTFGIPLTIFVFVFRFLIFPIAKLIAKVCLPLYGVDVEIFGGVPDDGKVYLVICNHTSFLDILLMALYFNGAKFTVILHQKLFWVPLLNFWLWMVGVIPIHPKTKKGVDKAKEKAAKNLKKGRKHLLIFPESTRTTTGFMNPFKSGAVRIALAAGVNIVPVGLAGSFEYKPKNRWWICPGKVVIFTGDPISTSGKTKEDLCVIAEQAVADCVQIAKEKLKN